MCSIGCVTVIWLHVGGSCFEKIVFKLFASVFLLSCILSFIVPTKLHAAPTPGITNGSVVKIRNVYSGKLLNVCVNTSDGIRDANGSNVDQFSDDGTPEETFKIEYVSSQDAYRFRSMISSNGGNRVIDIQRGGQTPSSGFNVQIWEPNDPTSQYFKIYPIGNNTNKFSIRPKANTNVALTVVDGSNGSATGTSSTSAGNVYLSTFNSSNTKQHFYFDIVNPNGDPYAALQWRYMYRDLACTHISGGFYPPSHNAIDIIRNSGLIDGIPIYTPCDGYLNSASFTNSAGYFVEFQSLTEDPVTDYYLRMGFYHLKYASPYNGQSNVYLPAGTLIGYTGNTGESTGSHLHFFVTKDGTYQSGGNAAEDVIDPKRFYPNVRFTGET